MIIMALSKKPNAMKGSMLFKNNSLHCRLVMVVDDKEAAADERSGSRTGLAFVKATASSCLVFGERVRTITSAFCVKERSGES